MANHDIVIYKAVFSNYDQVLPLEIPGVRKILFTDQSRSVNGWETRIIDSKDHALENRRIKMFPWLYFDSHFSIYLDGRLDLKASFVEFLLEQDLTDRMLFPRHRNRGDVLDELIRCVNHRKLNARQMRAALDLCKLDECAVECGLIVRDNSSPGIRAHADGWMERYLHIRRDQLALHGRTASRIHEIMNFDLSNDNYFTLRNHTAARFKQLISRFAFARKIVTSGLLLDN